MGSGRIVKRGRYLLVGALYAAIFIGWTWPLATVPSTSAVVPSDMPDLTEAIGVFARNDQLLSVWTATRNAKALVGFDLGRLVDNGLCYPFPDAATLGEHAIDSGFLAIPGYLLSRDPLVSYNVAVFLLVVTAGVTMFALVYAWTDSSAAAFVAGLLFAFHPSRLNDLIHPAVVGTHWIPLVILLFDRTLQRASIGSTFGLFVAATLSALTGSYPLLTLAIFGVPYATVRIAQLRSALPIRSFIALAIAILGVAVAIGPLLAAYADTNRTWHLFEMRAGYYTLLSDLLPGRIYAVGGLALVLALLAFPFRRRGSTEPTFAVFAGGLACLLVSSQGPIWPDGPILIPSYKLLAEEFPLLAIVRVPALIRLGVYLALAMMAGIGLAGALRYRSKPTVITTCVLLTLALLAETFFDPLATAVYQRTQNLHFRELRPDDAVLATYQLFDEADLDGPILDMPYNAKWGPYRAMPSYTLYAAYHGRDTAACTNSYLPATYDNVERLSNRFAVTGDPQELAAAGLPNVVWHEDQGLPLPDILRRAAEVTLLSDAQQITAMRIRHHPRTHDSPNRLIPLQLLADGNEANLQRFVLEIKNDSHETWALPRPVAPQEAILTWYTAQTDGSFALLDEVTVALLPPLALAPSAIDPVPLRVPAKPVGHYRVTLDVPAYKWHLTLQDLLFVAK